MLKNSPGKTLQDFMVEIDDSCGYKKAAINNAKTQPRLRVCLDQGSDGWAACNWLQSINGGATCVEACPDIPHGSWLDCKGAAKVGDMMHHMVEMTSVLSVWTKTFIDGTNYTDCKEAMQKYFQVTTPKQSALFQVCIDDIAADYEMLELKGTDVYEETIWELVMTVEEAMGKGSAPKLKKWYDPIIVGETQLKNWSIHKFRLLVMLTRMVRSLLVILV